ncbi:hypothetical protein JCM8097_004800 [Rhodosporidiobolus ruineniae]
MSNSDLEKASVHQVEEVALHGHAATDKYGRPLVHIDHEAEARLARKIDWHILPPVALIYLFCFIDRANISVTGLELTFCPSRPLQARLAGLERDLGLKGYDYNILLTAFYVAYVVFEFPCQMLNKWMGPGRSIPLLSTCFGVLTFVVAYCPNFGSVVAVRFLLGIAEGAIFPGLALYLSRFYRKDELGFRLACYIVCAPAAGAVGGLLASGILTLPAIGSVHSWRLIFFVEGIISMGLGVLSWFFLPNTPGACKWLTEEERTLAEARIKSENVGQTDVVDHMQTKAILHGVFNPTTLLVSLVFLLDNMVVQGVGFFLPTIIRTIFPGRTTVQQQLLSVPPYVVGAIFTLGAGYASFKLRKRGLIGVVSAVPMIIGYCIYVATNNPNARYGAAHIVALGAFSFGSICTTWVAANQTSDTARAAAIGTNVFLGNVGGLISTWMFLPKDGPRYLPGNSTYLAGSTIMLLVCLGVWMWQKKENRAKENGRDDHYLEGKTAQEIALLGQKHPGFRYAY